MINFTIKYNNEFNLVKKYNQISAKINLYKIEKKTYYP